MRLPLSVKVPASYTQRPQPCACPGGALNLRRYLSSLDPTSSIGGSVEAAETRGSAAARLLSMADATLEAEALKRVRRCQAESGQIGPAELTTAGAAAAGTAFALALALALAPARAAAVGNGSVATVAASVALTGGASGRGMQAAQGATRLFRHAHVVLRAKESLSSDCVEPGKREREEKRTECACNELVAASARDHSSCSNASAQDTKIV